jgi:hypothetical protein
MEKARFHLPTAEDQLWHLVIVRLLEQRDVTEEQAKEHLRLLEELAFHHRFCGRPLTVEFAEDTATWLAEARRFGSARDKAQAWLQDLVNWELLFRRVKNKVPLLDFAIPMLDEFFAARHLRLRYVAGDSPYRAWLPLSANSGLITRWLQRIKSTGWFSMPSSSDSGQVFRCPNPGCASVLPPFTEFIRQRAYADMLLLLALMVNEPNTEAVLLALIADCYPDFALIVIARLHHAHKSLICTILESDPPLRWTDPDLAAALQIAVASRHPENASATIECVITRLLRSHRWDKVSTDVLLAAGESAVGPLKKIIDSGDRRLDFVRMDAAAALGLIAGPRVVDLLIRWLQNDKSDFVRGAAAVTLCHIGDQRAIEPLLEALTDDYPPMRFAILNDWSFTDEAAVDALIQALEHERKRVRYGACSVLGHLRSARALTPLRERLADREVDVAQAARRAIDKITGDET